MLQAISRPLSVMRRLAADRRGVTAIVTGIALTALLGFAGLAIDVAAWLNATRGMQAAADQAAYSAALAAGTNGCPNTNATTQATAIAAARGYRDGVNNTHVTPGCNGVSQFKIRITQQQPMWFASLFLRHAPTAAAQATAVLASKVSDLCVLALDGTNVAAAQIGSQTDVIDFGGTTTLNLHCGIADDSNSSQAFAVGGNATVTATDVYLAGDDQGSPSGSATLTTSPTANNILRYQPPVEDPYLGRVFPAPTTACITTPPSTTTPLSPGLYCGGLTFGSSGHGHSDNYTLHPGIYYIVGGDLTLNASANVTASGVTFVLTGGTINGTTYSYATLQAVAGTTLTLTAPTSGPTGGMAFFQDRNAPSSATAGNCSNGQAQNKIRGGSAQLITGAIYFPNQSICFTGNSATTGAGQCTQLIARTLDFTGTSDVRLSCAGTGIQPLSVLVPTLIK